MPTPSGLANSDLIIAPRFRWDQSRRLVGTSGLQVSWQISGAGMLTCDVPLRDLRQAGLPPSGLLGKWVYYEHPSAGPWGGIITNVTAGDGMVSIGAEGWAAALRGVTTILTGHVGPTLIGALAVQINAHAAETGIYAADFDTVGGENFAAPAEVLRTGQDLYDEFLPAIVQRWNDYNGWQRGLQGAGWLVDPATRELRFDATIGTDKSATVALRDGRHVTSSDWADDLTDVINDVQLTAQANTPYSVTHWDYDSATGAVVPRVVTAYVATQATARADNLASIARYGRRSLVIEHEAVFPSVTALHNGALNLLTYYSRNEQLVTAHTADVDGIWSRIREGDIVYAWLANGDAAGRMVVRHRALDVGRGVMTYSGEADLT